jgi:cytosolic phospholipase A2
MHSGVVGSFVPQDVAQYLKDRILVSYLEMGTLDALVSPPTNKVLSTLLSVVPFLSLRRLSICW